MEFVTGTALPPPSDQRIAWFETTYRIALPADFVQILKRHNGAIPSTNLFSDGARERIIERMLCLLESPRNDEVHGIYDMNVVMTQLDARLISDEELVGMNVIPIASLFGGDFLCLDYRARPDAPTVSIWDHEKSEEFQPHLVEVAKLFGDFTKVLRRS